MLAAARAPGRERIRPGAALAPVVAILIAGNVTMSTGRVAAQDRIALPTLPPAHVRHPGLFDERGCALLRYQGGTRVKVCPVPSPTPNKPVGGSGEGRWQRLLGYEGPYYADTTLGTGVRVIIESVGVPPSKLWSAVGLIRNDTRGVATDIVVSARLFAPDGSVLATATVPVLVRNVRPGEPAPFSMRTTIERTAVGEIDWSVTSRPARSSAALSRMVEVTLSLARPLLDVDTNPSGFWRRFGGEATSLLSPSAEIAWGVLKSWSPRSIRRPSIVGLWLDERGRAVHLVTGVVFGRDAKPRPILERGATAEFALFSAGPRPDGERRGSPLRLVLWETPA